MTEQLRVTRMQDSKAMQEPKALSWKNIAVSGYDMFCFVNGTALDLQTKDGETVLQTFQRTGKAAWRETKDTTLQSRTEKIKKQQKDADRVMKELLEEDEKEKAAAAAGSQKNLTRKRQEVKAQQVPARRRQACLVAYRGRGMQRQRKQARQRQV
jgi:hypothetical protein